ncbi:hypothetical protein VNO77_02970 [Canavalia gladiata]|uniref:Uncharacterized protein n=1 Tax=Canavalia gladiata TaxID=3824 RepID=A0AAN9R7Q7_CANGL
MNCFGGSKLFDCKFQDKKEIFKSSDLTRVRENAQEKFMHHVGFNYVTGRLVASKAKVKSNHVKKIGFNEVSSSWSWMMITGQFDGSEFCVSPEISCVSTEQFSLALQEA